MRYLLILCFLVTASCLPNQPPKDSPYFRRCRRDCIRDGHPRARVVETETGYTCQCARAPEPEKT